jgi:hypothetical protein
MPLPTLETTKYTTTVPSTQQEIEYRPFLVKEEKILMMAQETNDPKAILKVTKDILSSCTFEKLDVNTLTMYDIEYLFLQLRMKSVGEIANIKLKCQETNEYVDYELDLSEVQVTYPEKKIDNKLQLTDKVGVTLKPISVDDAGDISLEKEDKQLVWGIAASIDTVYDEDSVYSLSDFSEKEVTEFVESLNRSQLEKIQEFITNQPTLSHTIKFKGPKGHDNEITITGLQSFFT